MSRDDAKTRPCDWCSGNVKTKTVCEYCNGSGMVLCSEFTCNECGAEATCAYAWDLWNVGGDCLASK